MAEMIKWGHDPTKEWRSKEFESVPSSQEYNEMATSIQLIEETQTGADISIEVKENNPSSNNAIKAMFDRMCIEFYAIDIQADDIKLYANDGSWSNSLLSGSNPYTAKIGFGTWTNNNESLLDSSPIIYGLPIIPQSADFSHVLWNTLPTDRERGSDYQEEMTPVQKQVSEDESPVLKTRDFGKYLSLGQKNNLKLKRKNWLIHHKVQLSTDFPNGMEVLFGKQECLVKDKNWRYMDDINYGWLLPCFLCYKLTGTISYKVKSPNGEKAKKGGKIITDQIETRFYCDCKGGDLYGTEDKAVSAEEIKKIMNTPPVPTQISELDNLTGCRWYNNILLIAGQPGWGKTRVSVIITLKILQNNQNAIVLYISQDMSQADTYEFFTERWGNKSWVKEFVEEKKDANSQPIPNSQRLVSKPLQTPTFDRLKEAIIQLSDDNPNKEIYVFVDHIGKFIGAVNDQEKSIEFMELMRDCLSSNNHCHIALLHYLNKKNTGTIKNKDDDTTTQQNEEKLFKKMTEQDVMGTSYIYSSVDHAIVAFGIEDENVIKLKSLKGRFGKRSEITELDSHPLCPPETPC